MKTVVIAFAAFFVAPGALLAKDLSPQPANPSKSVRAEKHQPILDRMTTQSIRKAMRLKTNYPSVAGKDGGAGEKRELSGIEVNPWIVPGFR